MAPHLALAGLRPNCLHLDIDIEYEKGGSLYRADFDSRCRKAAQHKPSSLYKKKVPFIYMSVRRSSIRGTFFPDGVLNILRIFRTGGAKYSRIFCAGVQKIGDAKYPMTPALIKLYFPLLYYL